MNIDPFAALLVVLLCLIGLYIGVRIVGEAWYRSKHSYTKRLIEHANQSSPDDRK